jgi:hypothetical protein
MPTVSITSIAQSQPLPVEYGTRVTVTANAGATVTVESTLASLQDVINGVATWAPWARGPVGAGQTVSDVAFQSTFVRAQSSGGTATLTTEEADFYGQQLQVAWRSQVTSVLISPSESGTENYQSLRQALNGGGYQSVDAQGVNVIQGCLPIPNNTTLDIKSGVTLRRGDGVNAPLLKNKDAAYLILATQFTRLSNVVTVNDASHTFGVGQKIYLPPARFTDTTFGGLITITAVTPGTWTYASTGSNGAGGTSVQFIPTIPITRSITPASLAAVTVNAVQYIRVTDSVGDLPIGTQVYLTSDNAADSGFIGLVDVAVVTPTGWVFKTPNNTAGVPVGNLQLNYSVGVVLINNGTIDGNLTNQTPTDFMRNNVCLFSNASHHRAEGGGRIISGRRAINYFNPSNIYVDVTVQNCSVGVQCEGGHKKVVVHEISGSSQLDTVWNGSGQTQASDDFFALSNTIYTGDGTGGAQDYDNTTSPFGFSTSEDVTINVLNCYNAGNGLKVTSDISQPVGSVLVNTIAMHSEDPNPGLLGTAVSIIDDGPHLSGTSYREIIVDRVIWDFDFLGTIAYRHLSHTAGGNCGRLIFRNIKDQNATTGTNFLFQPGTSAVSSMTNNGTTCTIVHDGLRKYVTGQRICISGVTSDVTWNQVWANITVTNSTTLTFLTSKATASTGTILMTGATLEQFVCERAKTLPAASGAHSNWQFGLGAIDAIEIKGWDVQQGAGTSTASIISLNTFYNQSLKVTDVTYSAVTNIIGGACISLAGNHKNIHMDNWRPRGLPVSTDTTNPGQFVPISLVQLNNTLIPQTINIYVSNSTLKAGQHFRDNSAVIGATVLNFFFDNTECIVSGGQNMFQFAGSATTQLNIFVGENCKMPTSQSILTGPNVRLNGPIYANLSALAAKFTGQVDGDTCISTTAVNGLPGTATRVQWSAILSKWVSMRPVLTGSTPLVAGTATVATALMQSTSEVRIRNRTTGGTPGAILPVTYTASTNFVLTSTSGTDTSALVWDLYGTN